VLFPEPLIVDVAPHGDPALHAWTSYVTPAATWDASARPVAIAFSTSALLPGTSLDQASAALDVSSRAWSTVTCSGITFSIVAPRAVVGDGGGDGHNDVIVHVDEWPAALDPGAVAHTVIRVAGDRILEADIHLNAKDYRYALGAVSGASDLRAILTHELGHLVGIGHTDVPRATMNASVPSGIAARSLEDDDRAAICALYPVATPAVKGCDRGSPCPTGYSCVGHACETPGESANLGAACDDASHAPDRCDGAGDHSPCIATSIGERCVVRCPSGDAGDDCGAGLHCVAIDGDAWCAPLDAEAPPDAGPGAGDVGDAGDARAAEAGPTGDGGGSGGCSLNARAPASGAPSWIVALLLACMVLRRR
jgi:hypothetical protein